MRVVVKLDVLDRAFRCANNSLIVLVVHLGGRYRVIGFDPRDHVPIVRWHDLGMLVCIPNHVSKGTRDDHL